MRVWLFGPFLPLPGDGMPVMRYQQLSRELARRGHDVVWWSTDFQHFHKRYRHSAPGPTPDDPYDVRLVHVPAYRRNVSLRRVLSHAWLAAASLKQAANQPRPDVLVCAMPPVELPAAVAAMGRRWRVPLCLDVSDSWPDAFLSVMPPWLKPVGGLVMQPYRRAVAYSVRQAQAVVAVSQTYLDWILGFRGQGHIPTAVYPHAATLRALGADPPAAEGALEVTFVGTFGLTYDLQIAVEAAALLEQRAPGQYRFRLVGTGPRFAEVQRTVRSPNVQLTGPLFGAELEQVLSTSHVGLCCYQPNAPQTLTIKLFLYLSYGLPVVGTLGGEMADFIQRHGVGDTVQSAEQMADALVTMRADADLWRKRSLRALAYTRENSLEREMARFADLLEGLAGG